MKRLKIFRPLLFSIILFGCSKNSNSVVEQPVTTLTGIVKDFSQAPLIGVKIFTDPATDTIVTDISGQFQMQMKSGGNYKVYAQKSGYSKESATVSVQNNSTNVVSFTLRNLVTISGKVINDTTATGIEGVSITLPGSANPITTSADGSFQLVDIPVGMNSTVLYKIGYSYTKYNLYVYPDKNSGYVISLSLLNPIEMISVTGGTFTMGDTYGDGFLPERPAHQVTVSSFLISKFELTQKQWIQALGYNPARSWADNQPVESVSWKDAVNYCNSRSSIEGLDQCYKTENGKIVCDFSQKGYRLPTEAEWEFAARGGLLSKNTKYSGNSNLTEVAWFYNDADNKTHDVGLKNPNELGIYDMSGNVWEFCWDYFSDTYYSAAPQTNPTGPINSQYRSLRGGSWADDYVFNRVYYRNYYGENDRGTNVGLRLVRSQ